VRAVKDTEKSLNELDHCRLRQTRPNEVLLARQALVAFRNRYTQTLRFSTGHAKRNRVIANLDIHADLSLLWNLM
jgi:hypothetical protein